MKNLLYNTLVDLDYIVMLFVLILLAFPSIKLNNFVYCKWGKILCILTILVTYFQSPLSGIILGVLMIYFITSYNNYELFVTNSNMPLPYNKIKDSIISNMDDINIQTNDLEHIKPPFSHVKSNRESIKTHKQQLTDQLENITDKLSTINGVKIQSVKPPDDIDSQDLEDQMADIDLPDLEDELVDIDSPDLEDELV
jgi:hypothetical protein